MSSIGDKPIQPTVIPQDQQNASAAVPGGQAEEAAKHAAANVSQAAQVPRDKFDTTPTVAAGGAVTGPAVPPPGLPPVNPTADEANGAAVLADNYNDAMGPVIASQSDDISKLSAETLMKFFMMLNILDPGNSVETQKNMAELRTNLKQQAIANVQKEIANLKDKIAQAEKKSKMWGFISTIMLFVNPMGLVSKMGGDSKTMGIIGGVLAPEQMLISMFGTGKDDIATLKKELEGAERRLSAVEYLVGQMGGDQRKKFDREAQEAVDKMKAETANVGEDGVPLKGLGQKLKGKIGQALQALQAIAGAEGPQAMMAAAPGAFKEAILPLFTELNLKDAEPKCDEMVALLVQQLTQGTLGRPDPNPLAGPMTTLLAEKLDPDAKFDADKEPVKAFSAAHQDVMQMLHNWAATKGTNGHNVNIQG